MMFGFLKKGIRNDKGFTLVELLVTISIFVILTGIVLFNQNSFNNGIILRNLGFDIALNIKQAQTYGIAVKESQSSFSSYGVYFYPSTDNKSFVLFSDTNNDGLFSGSTACPVGDPECIQKYSIGRGSFIKDICVNSDSLCGITNLTVLFKRPNPNALISYVNNFGQTSTSPTARIIISSSGNATTSVIITNAGQIYTSN